MNGRSSYVALKERAHVFDGEETIPLVHCDQVSPASEASLVSEELDSATREFVGFKWPERAD